jgi:hypothetical protein
MLFARTQSSGGDMAERKKRKKSATAELDKGWQAVIGKRAGKVAWSDPKPVKPKKKKRKPPKKAK